MKYTNYKHDGRAVLFAVAELLVSCYRATACNATHGIAIAKAFLSVRPSVSVKRVDRDKNEKNSCPRFYTT